MKALMILLQKEIENPYHNKKVQWPNFEWSSESFNLQFVLGPSEEVNGLYFQCETDSFWFPYFSILCRIAENRYMSDLPFLSWADFFDVLQDDEDFIEAYEEGDLPLVNYPLLLLRQAIESYRGESHCFSTKKDLLCCCFGVYKSQIEHFCENSPTLVTVDDITEELMAGGACRGCVTDIENFLLKRGQWKTILDFVCQLSEIRTFIEMKVLYFKSYDHRTFYFYSTNPDKFAQLSQRLQHEVHQKFRLLVDFIFTDLAD